MNNAQKRADRKAKFAAIGREISALTDNNPHWRELTNPNPWRVLPSVEAGVEPWARHLGMFTQQIDTGPGLCRKEERAGGR